MEIFGRSRSRGFRYFVVTFLGGIVDDFCYTDKYTAAFFSVEGRIVDAGTVVAWYEKIVPQSTLCFEDYSNTGGSASVQSAIKW